MKVTATDHMKYLDTMEAVDSDIMDKVLNAMDSYDYNSYTESHVRTALAKDVLNPRILPLSSPRPPSLFLKRWLIRPNMRQESILAIPSACSRLSTLPTTVKTNAFTADLIVKIRFTGPS